jgi:hypothetical protein
VNNRFNDGKGKKRDMLIKKYPKKEEVKKLFVLFCFVRFVGMTILSLWVSSFEIRWGGG